MRSTSGSTFEEVTRQRTSAQTPLYCCFVARRLGLYWRERMTFSSGDRVRLNTVPQLAGGGIAVAGQPVSPKEMAWPSSSK